MEVKDFMDLKKMLCKELEEVKNTKSLGMAEIEIIDKLTHSIKSICKIIEDEEGGYSGYSQGYYSRNGRYSRDDGNSDSYASRRGMHYVRGHYSRDDGRMMSNGRYSYASGMDEIISQMEELENDNSLSESERNMIRRAKSVLEH